MVRTLAAAIFLSTLCCPSVRAVTFDWAHIGNAGNAPDPETGFGAVSYDYAISKTEVTNSQYAEFLNAVAASDPHDLYVTWMGSSTEGGIVRIGSPGDYVYSVKPDAIGKGPGGPDGDDYSYANKPVVELTYLSVMRFVNWLHNGQGSGDTEMGVYDISDGLSETRSPNAKYWIPSEDEWYKAAYHDATAGTAGVYFDYPTSTDSAPDNNLPWADTGNSANFDAPYDTQPFNSYPLTDVGAYALSKSPYGSFDQGGNAEEWNEAVIDSSFRGFRGGSWDDSDSERLRADVRYGELTTLTFSCIGFRVATAPEPSTLLLSIFTGAGMMLRRSRQELANYPPPVIPSL